MDREAFIKGAGTVMGERFMEYYDHPGKVEYPWPGSRRGGKHTPEAEKAFYDGLRAKGYRNMWHTGTGDMVMRGKDGYHTWDHELGAIVPMLYYPRGEPKFNKHYEKVTE